MKVTFRGEKKKKKPEPRLVAKVGFLQYLSASLAMLLGYPPYWIESKIYNTKPTVTFSYYNF